MKIMNIAFAATFMFSANALAENPNKPKMLNDSILSLCDSLINSENRETILFSNENEGEIDRKVSIEAIKEELNSSNLTAYDQNSKAAYQELKWLYHRIL